MVFVANKPFIEVITILIQWFLGKFFSNIWIYCCKHIYFTIIIHIIVNRRICRCLKYKIHFFNTIRIYLIATNLVFLIRKSRVKFGFFFWFLRLTTNPLNLLGFLWFFAYALRSLHRNLFSCEVRIQASVQQIAWYIQEVSTFSQFLHTDCQFFASLFADSDSDVMVFCVCVKWCIVGVRNLFLVEMNINIWYGCWSCRLYTTNSWLTVLNFCFSTAILLLHFSSHSWILISIRYLTISKMSIFRCFVKSSKISIIFCFNSGFSFNFLSSALFSCNRATICDKWPKYYYIFFTLEFLANPFNMIYLTLLTFLKK